MNQKKKIFFIYNRTVFFFSPLTVFELLDFLIRCYTVNCEVHFSGSDIFITDKYSKWHVGKHLLKENLYLLVLFFKEEKNPKMFSWFAFVCKSIKS